MILQEATSLHFAGVVVVPASFDIDLATVILLVALVVVIALGVAWIIRGRRR